MSVITNTTVLSNFAAIGALERLHELFSELSLSTDVHLEVLRGLEDGYAFYSVVEEVLHPLAEQGWLRLTSLVDDSEVRLFSSMPSRLHAGEASSLAIAQNRGWLLLTDDKAARLEAAKRNVAVSGTLGCLVLGVERACWTLADANGWLARIVAAGFYSPVVDLSALIEKL